MADTHYTDDLVTLHHGDCLDVLRTLPDNSVDAVVTDPPYGLEFMGKDWDAPWKKPGADVGRGVKVAEQRADEMTAAGRGHTTSAGPYLAARVDSIRAAGAPFQQWCTEWATECLRVLKPGGHMLAFGGSRTWHRLAAAVEDAGFEIRDSIAWLYGSGFPKSMDVSKAIDKTGGAAPEIQARTLKAARERAGLTREQVAERVGCSTASVCNWEDGRARAKGSPVEFITPGPEYRDALANLLGYSADERTIIGATDDRRGDGTVIGLGHSGREYGAASTNAAKAWAGWGTALKPAFEPIVVGRKPLDGTVAANVLAHGVGGLNIDECRVSGEGLKASDYDDSRRTGEGRVPAGRFPANVLLDEHAAEEMDRQSGVSVSRAGGMSGDRKSGHIANEGGARGLAERGGHDDRGGASRFFPAFRYQAKAGSAERPNVDGVQHPTVKPIDLMRWLIRLVTPPGATVLEPFAGSGTTAEACVLEGRRCIAIEREADYLPLIVSRLKKPTQSALFDMAVCDDRN